MICLPNGLFDFQQKASRFLVATTLNNDKEVIVIKAPTGAGKTIILLDYIDTYLNINRNTAFIWLCPGTGNLEEQSMKKMHKYLPKRDARTLNEALILGFEAGSTTFINWELVTKNNNKCITPSESKNLFNHIDDAKRDGIDFIIIIDEEHSNDTTRAQNLINYFRAKKIVRVSATARENSLSAFHEIPEIDVISSGLITKAIYINEDVDVENNIDNHIYLIDLAIKKRNDIAQEYKSLSKDIRPLIIIQFPNNSTNLIEEIENHLQTKGYTYDNKLVAKWLDDEKLNINDIEEKNATPIVLLIKQAVAIGWDCPRAKILVKLRENMDESFTIQTIGRIRRMPEQKHYENELLDNCYLYTFDKTYASGAKVTMASAFDITHLFLKEKCKEFSMKKQLRDPHYMAVDERIVLDKINNYFLNQYNLTDDFIQNKLRLSGNYCFKSGIEASIIQGKFATTAAIKKGATTNNVETIVDVDVKRHSVDLARAIDTIREAISFPYDKTKVVLDRLFSSSSTSKKKVLSLNKKEYYAFIINNKKTLKEDFKNVSALASKQLSLSLSAKVIDFKIPVEERYFFDSDYKNSIELIKNAYEKYPSAVLVPKIRSKSERLFEKYCENIDGIDWIYKNGDKGPQYFSIVYLTGLEQQELFYPDYILKMKSGDTWIIETKGGEKTNGEDNNIDNQVLNKFNAFKKYAEDNEIKWGFVREKNEQLLFNNTEYTSSLSDEKWIPLEEIL